MRWPKSSAGEVSPGLVVGIVLLSVVFVFEAVRGVAVKKIGIPGVFEVEFGDNGREGTEPTVSDDRTVTTSGPTPTTAEISVGPWSDTVDGLTLQVERVIRLRDGSLEIDATVDNQTGDSLSLPVAGFFVANDDLGNSYEGDPFGSEWPDTFPSGKQTGGTIRIDVPVSQDAATLTINFTQVFGTFRVESIGIDGITLP